MALPFKAKYVDMDDDVDEIPMAEVGGEAEDTTSSNKSSLTLEQREALWGFTLPELTAASKVVSILFSNPQLFVGDTYLADSRLYTMITRDRQTKRANRDVYKQVMAEEKTRRDRAKRQQDLETIRKTTMKREREEALNALLQPPDDSDVVLLIEDRKEEKASQATLPAAAAGGSEVVRLRVTAAYESLCMLEHHLSCAKDEQVNQALVCHYTAQVYRYVPHSFSTQMGTPICLSSCNGNDDSSCASYGFITVLEVKQKIADLAASVQPLWKLNVQQLAPILRERLAALGRSSRLDALFDLLRETAAAERSGEPSVLLECRNNTEELDLFIASRVYVPEDLVGERKIPTGQTKSPNFYIPSPPDGLAELREDADADRPERERQYAAAFVHILTTAQDPMELRMHRVQKCHTCKSKYQTLHPYYYSMCRPCGEFNYAKRLMTRDLRGKVVLLTGCRIKIGYAMAMSLLRCGAVLIGTTRFAHDAVARFMEEPDYNVWKDRVHVYSLDLRDMWMVTQFCGFLGTRFPKLFAIINNAAQTIARTPEYTARLRAQETAPPRALRDAVRSDSVGAADEWYHYFLQNSSVSVGHSLQLEYHPNQREQPFIDGDDDRKDPQLSTTLRTTSAPSAVVSVPRVVYDRYDTQAEESDTRQHNSWTMRMHEVHASEAAEVMAINALSPFVLNSKLKPLLLNREGDTVPNDSRFIINVSAMEGQFYRFKQVTHPHTNMAKAALNMMTRTSADDYYKDGIFMNSVDTGWITDESPQPKKERRADSFMLCPLDEVDAAARCLDLVYTDSREYGKFWKDFHVIPW